MSRGRQRRALTRAWPACVAFLALMPSARADTSLRVRLRLPADRVEAVAGSLAARGFDVVPAIEPGAALEVVVSESEATALRRSGFAFAVVDRGAPAATSPTLSRYPTLDEVLARMRRTASMAPRIARFVDLTEELGAPATFENRHIHALRISDNAAWDEDEPAVLVMAGLHARELVNPLIALDVAERLVTGYGVDPAITEVVDAYEIWIAPIWNPDGYAYVFSDDNLWRKNRQPFDDGVGVDLNRNFPYGWESDCAGATSAASRFYKGPSPASDRETRAMLGFTEEIRFAKVLEFHSPGREVLWGSPCSQMPFDGFAHDAAVALSEALGYSGRTRTSSADGEHHQWQSARIGALSFLAETETSWQPPYDAALAEVEQVWPGVLWFLRRPISISGHVTDGCTSAPLSAAIDLSGEEIATPQRLESGGPYGRFQATLPPDSYRLTFTAPGYLSQVQSVEVGRSSAAVLEVALVPSAPPGCGDAPTRTDDEETLPSAWGCGCAGGEDASSGVLVLILLFAGAGLPGRRA